MRPLSLIQALPALALAVLSLGLAGCGQILDRNQTNFLTLRREFQIVRHYGCDGGIVSERKREVNEPAAWVRVKPEVADPVMVGFSEFKVMSTEDTTGMTTDLFSFYIHIGEAPLGFRVVPGKNTVKYSFWGCRRWSDQRDSAGKAICLDKGSLLETGFLELDVAYEERERDLAREVGPAEVVCQNKAAQPDEVSKRPRRDGVREL